MSLVVNCSMHIIIDIFLDYMPHSTASYTSHTVHLVLETIYRQNYSINFFLLIFFLHSFSFQHQTEHTQNAHLFIKIEMNFWKMFVKFHQIQRPKLRNRNRKAFDYRKKKNVVFMVFGMVSCLLLIYEFRSLFDVFIKPNTTTHYKHLHFGRIDSAYCMLWMYECVSQSAYVCRFFFFLVLYSCIVEQIGMCAQL